MQRSIESQYGQAFEERPGCGIFQTRVLTAWDEWIPTVQEERIHLWSGEMNLIQRLTPDADAHEHIPFTAYELTGFNSPGPYLVFLSIRLLPSSFKRFVRDPGFFTVDGPRGLLCRIDRDIMCMGEEQADKWLAFLSPFRHYIDPGEGYDVIILQEGDRIARVKEKDSFHIAVAPMQHCPGAVRYITKGPGFCLALQLAEAENGRSRLPAQHSPHMLLEDSI